MAITEEKDFDQDCVQFEQQMPGDERVDDHKGVALRAYAKAEMS